MWHSNNQKTHTFGKTDCNATTLKCFIKCPFVKMELNNPQPVHNLTN